MDFKTQVFVPHEHDHFRTRLTHTLEVAQVARTLGRALHLNEDLVEVVALAHDLGHPPFGHAGEKALDSLMAHHGRFEHNRHALRVVDHLEHPYPDFRGLNLTHVVRECLAKHETRYDTPICDDFDTSLRAPLEGQLVDLADSIAWTTADLEDSLSAGWIDREGLGNLALWRRAWGRTERAFPSARPIHKQIRACKGVLAAMADDVLAETRRRIFDWKLRTPDDVRRAPDRAVSFSPGFDEEVTQLQTFLLDRVYRHPDSREHDRRAQEIVRAVFEAFVSDPDLLPSRYRARVAGDGLHRVVCDYVAGMTDRFCRQEHERVSA
jgi:dGTPase